MNKEKNIIELQHVRKCYEGDTAVIEDFSLEIKKGEFVTFLGPSGCGKTTILRMIGGFEMPTAGNILLHGEDITKVPPNKRPINTVFQKYALFPYLNVYDNIAFGLKMKKFPKEEMRKKVKKVLEIVDLEGFEKRKTDTLSGGQQQRVAIARAIVNEPEILLLDEPLGALDYKMRKEMQFELKEMHKELGITFIFVTHDQEEALSISDFILLLKKGQVQQYGLPQDLYDHPCNVFAADFLGNPPINLHEARTEEDGVVLEGGGARFWMQGLNEAGVLPGRKIFLGTRSEAIEAVAGDEHGTAAMVKNIFLNGKETLYLLDIGGQEFRCTLESGKACGIGETMLVRLKKKGVHLYDLETGEKISKTP